MATMILSTTRYLFLILFCYVPGFLNAQVHEWEWRLGRYPEWLFDFGDGQPKGLSPMICFQYYQMDSIWNIDMTPHWGNDDVWQSLLHVDVTDDLTAYGFLVESEILKTTDAGFSWQVIPTPSVGVDCASVSSSDTLYVSNVDIIYSSYDGGMNWQALFDAGSPVHGISIQQNGRGMLIRESPFNYRVMRTVDHGQTWTQVYNNDLYSNIRMVSDSIAFGMRNSHLWRTADFGLSWTDLGLAHEVSYAGDDHIYAYRPGELKYSGDKGATWQIRTLPVYNLNKIYFANGNRGYIVRGHISYRTDDGGITWTQLAKPTQFPIAGSVAADMQFASDSIGFVIYTGDLFKTLDGGRSWSNVNDDFDYDHYQVMSADTILAIQSEQLYISTDGGVNFAIVNGDMNASVSSMHFHDIHNGFFTRSDGFYKTSDGGISFQEILIEDADLQYWVNNQLGFAYDWSSYAIQNKLWKTVDGGETWNEVGQGPLSPNSIYFFNEQRGWIYGTNHWWFTADGGLTWTQLDVLNNIQDHQVYFTDTINGTIIDHYNELIYTTMDGGITWNSQACSDAPVRIHFHENRGYIITSNGNLYTTNVTPQIPLPVDPNGDFVLDENDITAMIANYGCINVCDSTDLDGDGVTDMSDLMILLSLL